MCHYNEKVLEEMNAVDCSDSEREEISQMSRSVKPIQSEKSKASSTEDHLLASVNVFFQSKKINCFLEAEGMAEKAQPWRQIWAGPQPPREDGKLLVACPKNCQWGSGSGLGGY